MNAKQKGNRFERECASILRAELWPECYTSRFMGCAWDDYNGIDLTGTGDFQIQCKHVEKLSPGYHEILKKKMPQNGLTNVILHKRNNKGVVAVMRFEDFMKILKGTKRGEK